jgi:CheY-like chemotaxis protein
MSKILVVEDEFIIAEVIMDLVQDLGVGVCEHASSLDDALKAANEGDWTGAFLDIRLNGQLVYPVAERLHARGVPFAFCSGGAEAESIPAAFAGIPILPKPWNDGEFEQLAQKLFPGRA